VLTNLYVPDGTPEQVAWFDELQRTSSSAEMAARIRAARDDIDVTTIAKGVSAPALVLHVRDDAVVPFAEGRRMATLVPGARFVPLEGRNHIVLADEPAWPAFLGELQGFLESRPVIDTGAAWDLSPVSNRCSSWSPRG
jgi:pimeloyl-ACP methyl ester carboxylesterase